MQASKEKLLWQIGIEALKELETEEGILASGRQELYGCIFGRDSLIVALKLLSAYEHSREPYFLGLARKIIINLAELQGTQVNLESGEEPGKCIHEFRPSGHEHLTRHLASPWHVYSDGVMRNYDTVDATPLFLIAVHRYGELVDEKRFWELILPKAMLALNWVLEYGDKNNDGLIDYEFSSQRSSGGLKVQNWMDSNESLFHEEDGRTVDYPVAPSEVQAYAYAALRRWASYFRAKDPELYVRLSARADRLKEVFNARYLCAEDRGFFVASAMGGDGAPVRAVRSSMGHCLWASWKENPQLPPDGILEGFAVPMVAERLLQPDLFEPKAGIRTLSAASRMFQPNSYHNGSIWPHDTAVAAEGLEAYGFVKEAEAVRLALLAAFDHFRTPLELFAFTDTYEEYRGINGQRACRTQAWSAAALVSEIAALRR